MNIVFDVSYRSSGSRERGIGRYSENLMNSIIERAPNNRYFTFDTSGFNNSQDLLDSMHNFMREKVVDLYYIHSPIEHNTMGLHIHELYKGMKVAATFYDAIPAIYPDKYLSSPDVRKKYFKNIDLIKTTDYIFAISNRSRTDAYTYLNIPLEKVTTIHGGVDPIFIPSTHISQDYFYKFYHIRQPFIIANLGDDDRKNQRGLINAFLEINKILSNKFQLVIVCRTNNYRKHSDIVYTGYVPDEVLVALYNHAKFSVFPSFYEGFGFPVVESMACGTPVITSNTSSLIEIAKGRGVIIDPSDVRSIMGGIYQAATKPSLMKYYSKIGLTFTQNLGWPQVADKIIEKCQIAK